MVLQKDTLWSFLLQQKVMRLAQFELMIESGNSEYETYYQQLEKETEGIPLHQINEVASLLLSMFQTKKDKMSEIEQEVYKRSITRLNHMKNRDSLRTKNIL